GLARGFGGPVGLAVAAALASVGAVAWAVRDPLSLAVLASPVALEAAVLLAANVPLAPRYFALALPPVVVAVGMGLTTARDAIVRAADGHGARLAADGLAAAFVVAAALPLAGYYRVPKQDFQGAI